MDTVLSGKMFIGNQQLLGKGEQFYAVNPSTAQTLEPAFFSSEYSDVDRACELAQQAFVPFSNTSLAQRAEFIETIANNIMQLGDALVQRAMAETGLPQARIEGERGRTCNQLKLFAQVVRDGRFIDARIDPALPERAPLPRADLRMRKVSLGPVAVFGASNFPLAFSVAGGDTASAFAAGSPVVAKAHSAHPGTSELVAKAIQQAVADCNLPEGTFSMLFDSGIEIGAQLVAHPVIQAVGFTGSRAGGTALMNIANSRDIPIPVYAEMSSINPVFLGEQALAAKAESIAEGFVASLLMGAGQFCTNPGLIIAQQSAGLDKFLVKAKSLVGASSNSTMLTAGIYQSYLAGISSLAQQPSVECVARGPVEQGNNQCSAGLYVTDAKTFLMNPNLSQEIFGSSSLVVKCDSPEQVLEIAQGLEGQLTATLQVSDNENASQVQALVSILESKVGRILFNGYPTGVEVCHAMVHGGPFPATSATQTTSVGSAAIDRFLRPVCYQDVPEQFLPESLKDNNPQAIPRLIDGKLES